MGELARRKEEEENHGAGSHSLEESALSAPCSPTNFRSAEHRSKALSVFARMIKCSAPLLGWPRAGVNDALASEPLSFVKKEGRFLRLDTLNTLGPTGGGIRKNLVEERPTQCTKV